MQSLVQLIIVALPALVVVLLAGLASLIRVVANEGRGRTSRLARALGVLELVLVVPFAIAAIGAEASDVRGMFVFAALAFGFVGAMNLRMVARYRE